MTSATRFRSFRKPLAGKREITWSYEPDPRPLSNVLCITLVQIFVSSLLVTDRTSNFRSRAFRAF